MVDQSVVSAANHAEAFFGELKDNETRMEAEYIIIGTMLSFTWALAVAWLTQWAKAAI